MAESDTPRTWREAIPYVIWIVLVLGFGLELTAALVHADWLRAFVSFCAMLGMMAAALHWPQLRKWAFEINPNWVIGAFIALLISVALIPFIEQERWPFAGWFDRVTEKQKATLIEWLQHAHRERDQAIQERDRTIPSALTESLQSALASTRKTLEDTRSDRDQIKQQLVTAQANLGEAQQGRDAVVRHQQNEKQQLPPKMGATSYLNFLFEAEHIVKHLALQNGVINYFDSGKSKSSRLR